MSNPTAFIARRAAIATIVLFGCGVGCGPADDAGEGSQDSTSTTNDALVGNGGFCFTGTRCQSGVCYSFSCRAPVCTDGVKNGSETGVDCGGSVCPPCAGTCTDGVKNGSETGVDCGGAVCPPCAGTCTDGVKNGSETDVDCGGSCAKCARGRACASATDCTSNIYFFGICR